MNISRKNKMEIIGRRYTNLKKSFFNIVSFKIPVESNAEIELDIMLLISTSEGC